MDLVREILKEVSESSEPLEASAFTSDDRDRKTVLHHFEIMRGAGLVRLSRMGTAVDSLTWEGHDFLSAVESDTVWRKTKMAVSKTAGSAALDTVKAVASKIAMGMIEAAI